MFVFKKVFGKKKRFRVGKHPLFLYAIFLILKEKNKGLGLTQTYKL